MRTLVTQSEWRKSQVSLGKTIATKHNRRILDGLTAQNAATAPTQGAGTAGRGNTQPPAKTAHTAQEDGAGGDMAQG